MPAKLYLYFPQSNKQSPEISAADKLVAGRSAQCDLDLNDYFEDLPNAVSRKHFMIRYDNSSFIIEDISTHSTQLQGFELTRGMKRVLQDGDEIGLINDPRLTIKVHITDQEGTGPIIPSTDPTTETVVELLAAQRDVILLGMAGTGKTTLLERLASRSEALSLSRFLLFYHADCLGIDEPITPVTFFRFLITFTKPSFKRWPTEIRDSYKTLLKPNATFGDARMSILDTIRIVHQHTGKGIVFMLDQFDDVYAKLSPQIFSILKTIQQRYPSVFFVFTMQKGFREINTHLDQFLRHNPGKVWMLPFDDQKLRGVVNSYGLTPEETDVSLRLGGRQPGLTGLIAKFIQNRKVKGNWPQVITAERLISQLLSNNAVSYHCRLMWESLLPDEQAALKISADKGFLEIKPDLQEKLTYQKFVLTDEEEDSTFTSPLFEAYIRSMGNLASAGQEPSPVPAQSGLVFDEPRSEFIVEGQRIIRGELTELEESLLRHLYQNAGRACSIAEISKAVWDYNVEEADDFLEQEKQMRNSIARVIASLRRKFNEKSSGAGERYIKTVRGRGYMCVTKTDKD